MRRFLFSNLIRLGLVTFILFASMPIGYARAQTSGAYYTVQEGDTLTQISQYFNTTTGRILTLNPIPDPDSLVPGIRLFIPGFEDLSGEIISIPLPPGDSVHILNRALHQGEAMTARLNFLTSPDEMYAGEPFFYLAAGGTAQTRLSLTTGINAAEFAVQTQTNPWLAAEFNSLRGPWSLVRNDTIFLPGSTAVNASAFLPTLSGMTVSKSALLQGKTSVIQAVASPGTTLSGSLLGYPLHFFTGDSGRLTALQGIPRMADPGITTLTVTTSTADGRTYTHQQKLLVKYVDYGYDAPLDVADNVVDPAVTEPEFAQLMQLTADAPPEKMWNAIFLCSQPQPGQNNFLLRTAALVQRQRLHHLSHRAGLLRHRCHSHLCPRAGDRGFRW